MKKISLSALLVMSVIMLPVRLFCLTQQQIQDQIKTLQAQQTFFAGQIKVFQDQQTSLAGQIKTLQDQQTSLAVQIKTLQAQQTFFAGQIKTLQGQLAPLSSTTAQSSMVKITGKLYKEGSQYLYNIDGGSFLGLTKRSDGNFSVNQDSSIIISAQTGLPLQQSQTQSQFVQVVGKVYKDANSQYWYSNGGGSYAALTKNAAGNYYVNGAPGTIINGSTGLLPAGTSL